MKIEYTTFLTFHNNGNKYKIGLVHIRLMVGGVVTCERSK